MILRITAASIPPTQVPVALRRIGARTFDFSREVAVMAIINRRPDSFFDQGSTFELDQAVDAAGRKLPVATISRKVRARSMSIALVMRSTDVCYDFYCIE